MKDRSREEEGKRKKEEKGIKRSDDKNWVKVGRGRRRSCDRSVVRNYRKEPRMGFDIRKKGKNEKAEEFVREMKERHEEARAALVKSQKKMKKQADRNRKEAEEYRVGDKILISTKDFLMKLIKKATKKLTEKFIGPYVVRKIMSKNAVELELPVSLRIHPVVNIRRIVKYRE